MTERDGRDGTNDSESVDWLLAQLGQGRRPDLEGENAPPPVAEPSVEPPAEPIAPPAAEVGAEPEPEEPVGRRSEETLDWFSLAEPAPAADAATRALPVVGEPIEPRVEPVAPAAPDASVPPAEPVWTPPAGVRPPSLSPESPPEPSRLTSVEPPVGIPPVLPPAAVPPVAPASAPPAAPPGPVTPATSFALTWGDNPIDSEEGLRDAFRRLSEPAGPQAPDAAATTPAAAEPPMQPTPPAAQPTPPPSEPPAADEPFAGYTAPPISRGSFTPMQPGSSAPPSWDEIAAAATASAAAAPPTPEQPAPAQPRTPAAPGREDELARELWAALNEPTSPQAASEPRAVPEPQAEVEPPAPPTPEAPPAFQAFGAFGEFGAAAAAAEPTTAESVQPDRAPEPPQSDASAQPRSRFSSFADDMFEAPVVRTPSVAAPVPPPPGEPTGYVPPGYVPPAADAFDQALRGGAPALGGDTFEQLLPIQEASPAPSEPEMPPHRSFTPASFGNPTPVDDLLAALGGASHGHEDRGTFGQAAADAEPVDAPNRAANPLTGPIALAFTELGLSFGDTAVRGARGDEGGPVGRPVADAGGYDSDSEESAIARQIAETGYFWNLTPDPSGVDPKAAQDEAEAASRRGAAAPQPEPEPEPEPEAFDPFAHTRPAADAANPLTDPFGMRLVFGDERVPPAAAGAAAAAASSPVDDDSGLDALFGAGPSPVGAAFPDSQPDPWSTAGYGAAGLAGAAAAPAAPAAPVARPADAAGPAGPGAPAAPASPRSGGGGRRPLRVLAWIAGGLVAALVLVGLFFLGTRLTGGAGTATSASESAAPSTPAPAPEPTAAQPAGVHAWNTLFGGECLEPFTDPWAEEFTVVDCATPHAAQLVYRGTLPGDAAAAYPGEPALVEQMPALCSAAGIFDLTAAAGIDDLQVQGTYPLADQWAEGARTYYCFANRAGGEPLTVSIQGPGPQA